MWPFKKENKEAGRRDERDIEAEEERDVEIAKDILRRNEEKKKAKEEARKKAEKEAKGGQKKEIDYTYEQLKGQKSYVPQERGGFMGFGHGEWDSPIVQLSMEDGEVKILEGIVKDKIVIENKNGHEVQIELPAAKMKTFDPIKGVRGWWCDIRCASALPEEIKADSRTYRKSLINVMTNYKNLDEADKQSNTVMIVALVLGFILLFSVMNGFGQLGDFVAKVQGKNVTAVTQPEANNSTGNGIIPGIGGINVG